MHTDDIVELSSHHLVLTMTEAMRTLNMTEDAAGAALDAVHGSFPNETQLLYVVRGRQSGAVTTTLCVGPEEADKVLAEVMANTDSTAQKYLYGLQRTAVLKARNTPSTLRTTPRLRFVQAPQLRAYPLASRDAVERGEAPRVGVHADSASPVPVPAIPVAPKREAMKVEPTTTASTGVAVKKEPEAEAIKATAAPAMPFAVKMEAKVAEPVAAAPPPAPVALAESATASPPSVSAPAPRQLSLLSMMMSGATKKGSAAATDTTAETATAKRARVASPAKSHDMGSTPTSTDATATAAPSPKKKKTEGRPAKAAATTAKKKKTPSAEVPTRSLAKLAKASAKDGAGSAATATASRFDFDEEASASDAEEEASRLESEDQFLSHEAFNEEAEGDSTAAMDLVVTAVNDDIILCDDVAPLAFREPTKAAPATSTATVDNAASRRGDDHPTPGASAPQRRLSTFFNPEVVALQNQYAKETDTDMRLENDEYVCVDVIVYRHKETGKVISEEAFHQLTADVLARQASAAQSPSHTPAKDAGNGGSSPAAAASNAATPSTKHGSRMKVAQLVTEEDADDKRGGEAAQPAQRPVKNLLSFFKK